jgi:predicted CoA-binding protein
MTPDERSRTIAYLDLQECRGPDALLGEDGIRELLATSHRIAVIGASDDPRRPSHDVFRHLIRSGFDCVPVNPRTPSVAGVPAYPTLADAVAATGPFDIVDVFRRADQCAVHAREAVAVEARCLWLQLGIVDWESARIAEAGGLAVVMDRCLSVEWRRLGGRPLPPDQRVTG